MLKDVITEHAKATADNTQFVGRVARPSVREAYQRFFDELDEAEAREREAIIKLREQLVQLRYEGKKEERDTSVPLSFTSPVCSSQP